MADGQTELQHHMTSHYLKQASSSAFESVATIPDFPFLMKSFVFEYMEWNLMHRLHFGIRSHVSSIKQPVNHSAVDINWSFVCDPQLIAGMETMASP